MPRARSINPKVHAITSYPSIGRFLAQTKVGPGFHVIEHGNLPIDLLVQDRGHKTTVVFLHGAVRADQGLPVITGLGISRDVPVNRIFISDPSLILDPDMNLGWYAGNSEQRLQPILQDIVAKVVASFGSERLVFFGPAGGGFAALYLSAHFPGSLAVALSPHTNIARHQQADVVAQYAEACFGVTGEDPVNRLPHSITTDLSDLYSRPLPNTVAYVRNAMDAFHTEHHRDPFVANLHPENQVFEFAGNHWGAGHAAPPRELVDSILQVAAGDEWAKGLEGLGFARN
jgi:hypothetical protein